MKNIKAPGTDNLTDDVMICGGKDSVKQIIIIIINLIYIAQFDTNGIFTALYVVITYIQMQYMHVWTYMKQSYKYTYIHVYT